MVTAVDGVGTVNRVLVISPHPDDAELGCGGTLARLREQSSRVEILTLSDCAQTVGSPHKLREEAKAASRSLGCGRIFAPSTGFSVRRFNESRQEILDWLVSVRDDFMPDLVFAPSLSDTHQDHQVAAAETFRAFKHRVILGYVLPWNSRTSDQHVYVRLKEAHVDRKAAASSLYETQVHRPYMSSDFLRAKARVDGVACGAEYAEVFDVMRAVL